MLHDQGQDLEAGNTLEKHLQRVDRTKMADAERAEHFLQEIRVRMNYYFACHWQARNDCAKEREYLDRALEIDPADVDVLISCYRLPDQKPDYHAKIVDLIQRASREFREKLAEKSDDPLVYASNCNNYAWLIGNTEGDFDQALKFAKTAVELRPDEGGLIDTMARVYYAKGDLETPSSIKARPPSWSRTPIPSSGNSNSSARSSRRRRNRDVAADQRNGTVVCRPRLGPAVAADPRLSAGPHDVGRPGRRVGLAVPRDRPGSARLRPQRRSSR